MPRVKRNIRMKAKVSYGKIGHLLRGRDFFGDGYGKGLSANIEQMRADWQDPAVRKKVWDRYYQEETRFLARGIGEPWAVREFDGD